MPAVLLCPLALPRTPGLATTCDVFGPGCVSHLAPNCSASRHIFCSCGGASSGNTPEKTSPIPARTFFFSSASISGTVTGTCRSNRKFLALEEAARAGDALAGRRAAAMRQVAATAVYHGVASVEGTNKDKCGNETVALVSVARPAPREGPRGLEH